MDQQSETRSKNTAVLGIVAIAVLVILVAGVMTLRSKDNTAQSSQTNSTGTSQQAGSEAAESTGVSTDNSDVAGASAGYKSGTYSATGSYESPGGTERVAIKLTLEGGIISDIAVTPQAASPTSKQYQGEFVSGYKGLVEGKDIDEIKLSKVSGSSLTSRGFNDALDQIKNQAQS
ncbi:MAG TPA: FMN-binding protein [Candidatus Saccharimonadales bacterium]|nr:FMN-binding protein [Candidatus Saccharimonadales bacterium]